MKNRHPILFSFIIVLAGLAACEWWVRSQMVFQPAKDFFATFEETSPAGLTTSSDPSESTKNELIDSKLPELVDVLDFIANQNNQPSDVTAFSWQDPFDERFWNSSGWAFYAKGMQTHPAELGIAVFGRPYRKLMFEFRIEPVEAMQAFQIQLISPSTGATTGIVFEEQTIAVIANSASQQSLIARAPIQFKRRNPKLHTGHLHVAATGNRIIIAWNGRRVLTCEQPAEQSGRNIYVGLVSSSNSKRIKLTDMRIEGE